MLCALDSRSCIALFGCFFEAVTLSDSVHLCLQLAVTRKRVTDEADLIALTMPTEAQHLNTSMMKLSSIFSDSSMLIISLAKFFGCKGIFDTTDCGILGKCCLLENTHLFSYVFTIYLVEKNQRAAWYERRDCCKSKVAEHSNEFLALPVSQLLCACEADNTSFADCTLLGCRLAQAVKTILELMEERLEQRFSKPFRFNENWPHISQSGTTWLCRSCTLFILHGAK